MIMLFHYITPPLMVFVIGFVLANLEKTGI